MKTKQKCLALSFRGAGPQNVLGDSGLGPWTQNFGPKKARTRFVPDAGRSPPKHCSAWEGMFRLRAQSGYVLS